MAKEVFVKAEFYGVAPLLQVYDMPSAVRFYRDVLGFELLNRSGEGEEFDWCLLARNGAEVMLNTMYEREQRPPEPELKRAAAHGDTGLFFVRCELDAVYEHLRGHSVEADPPRTASYGMRQLYFKDPDGYGICVQWPADERWAQQWRDRYGFAA
jgi:catechol 2,3-dioxygenase-like lactoylglutathione lyase family enzyme